MTEPSVEILSKDIRVFQNEKYHSASLIILRPEFPQLSDEDIARFLIARGGVVDKAREMLKAHMEWRSSNLPIYKEACIGEISKGKIYNHGVDKEGHPLVVFRPKMNDCDVRDVEETCRMALWWTEAIVAQMPSDISKATLFVNRTGGENNADVPLIRMIAGIMQSNYPERLHKAIIYPSGLVFWALWNMLKYVPVFVSLWIFFFRANISYLPQVSSY